MQVYDSIATLRNTVSFLSDVKKQAIVKPNNLKGIGGFLFDFTENDSIKLQSDITEHYIEDNTAIIDHIALKPEIVVVNGFVGELTNRLPEVLENLETIVDKLDLIDEYIPEYSVPIRNLYETVKTNIQTVNEAIKGVENLYNLFTNNNLEDKSTKQAQAFSFFYAMWSAREIFTVDTPFKTFTNMAIEDMEAIQGDSNTISEFNITFKKLRFVNIDVINKNQGRRINQLSDVINKGNSRGEEVSESIFNSILTRFGF